MLGIMGIAYVQNKKNLGKIRVLSKAEWVRKPSGEHPAFAYSFLDVLESCRTPTTV